MWYEQLRGYLFKFRHKIKTVWHWLNHFSAYLFHLTSRHKINIWGQISLKKKLKEIGLVSDANCMRISNEVALRKKWGKISWAILLIFTVAFEFHALVQLILYFERLFWELNQSIWIFDRLCNWTSFEITLDMLITRFQPTDLFLKSCEHETTGVDDECVSIIDIIVSIILLSKLLIETNRYPSLTLSFYLNNLWHGASEIVFGLTL